MKYILFSFLIVGTWACGGKPSYTKAASGDDAGREFIRASLDGDIEKARFYLLKDSTNLHMLNIVWKENTYDKLSNDEKREYRNAQIRPIKIEKEGDTALNYSFANSYKQNDTTVIHIVLVNGEWLVDLKRIH